MNKIIKTMIELSDLQKEIFDEMIKKYPKSNTPGGFSDLISSRDLKLTGAKGLHSNLKDLSFKMAIENLLHNAKGLNLTLKFKNYDSLIKRINTIRDELIEIDALEVLLEISKKKLRHIDYDSFEYKFMYSKHHYNILMFMDLKDRHNYFMKYYSKCNFDDALSKEEVLN